MKPVLLGIAGASAAKFGNLLDRSARVALDPFADVLHSVANSFSPHESNNVFAEVPGDLPLADRIQETLSAAGIEIDDPLKLTIRGGKLSVDGDQPQRSLIEAALAQDPTLVDELSTFLQADAGASNQDSENDFSHMAQESRSALLTSFAGEARLDII